MKVRKVYIPQTLRTVKVFAYVRFNGEDLDTMIQVRYNGVWMDYDGQYTAKDAVAAIGPDMWAYTKKAFEFYDKSRTIERQDWESLLPVVSA